MIVHPDPHRQMGRVLAAARTSLGPLDEPAFRLRRPSDLPAAWPVDPDTHLRAAREFPDLDLVPPVRRSTIAASLLIVLAIAAAGFAIGYFTAAAHANATATLLQAQAMNVGW